MSMLDPDVTGCCYPLFLCELGVSAVNISVGLVNSDKNAKIFPFD